MEVPTVQGIDVSHHQGSVDFTKVGNAGYRFVLAKCTEGQGCLDPSFESNWSKLRDLEGSLARGAYHYGHYDTVGGRSDGEAEARDFCSALKAAGGYGDGALPPAIDLEVYGKYGVGKNIDWLEGFIQVVEQELGRSPMIYTGSHVWGYQFGNTNELIHLPLWQVCYTKADAPCEGLPWPTWTIWQWSGGGKYAYGPKVPGVSPDPGVTDLDRFAGSESMLQKLVTPTFWTPASPWKLEQSTPVVQSSLAGIMPLVDLATAGTAGFDPTAAQVQGLLLAHGYGPDGLVGSNGRPDGKPGSKTLAALMSFKSARSLPSDGVVDGATWWMLLSTK